MNKHLVITGGTKGIGRAIIFYFAENGFDITTCSRNLSDIEKLDLELKDLNKEISFRGYQNDLSQKDQCKAFIQKVIDSHREVNVLINNAGSFIPGEIHLEPDEHLDLMLRTNLNSAYFISKGLIGLLKKSKGHLLNICSIASILPYTSGGSYCISKFALYGMNKILREEMKPFGVKVTAVLPGATFSSSWERSGVPESRLADPADIAKAIYMCSTVSDRTVIEDLVIRPQEGDL